METILVQWLTAHPFGALFVAAGGPWLVASALASGIRAAGWDVYPAGRAALAILSDFGGARKELRTPPRRTVAQPRQSVPNDVPTERP